MRNIFMFIFSLCAILCTPSTSFSQNGVLDKFDKKLQETKSVLLKNQDAQKRFIASVDIKNAELSRFNTFLQRFENLIIHDSLSNKEYSAMKDTLNGIVRNSDVTTDFVNLFIDSLNKAIIANTKKKDAFEAFYDNISDSLLASYDTCNAEVDLFIKQANSLIASGAQKHDSLQTELAKKRSACKSIYATYFDLGTEYNLWIDYSNAYSEAANKIRDQFNASKDATNKSMDCFNAAQYRIKQLIEDGGKPTNRFVDERLVEINLKK